MLQLQFFELNLHLYTSTQWMKIQSLLKITARIVCQDKVQTHQLDHIKEQSLVNSGGDLLLRIKKNIYNLKLFGIEHLFFMTKKLWKKCTWPLNFLFWQLTLSTLKCPNSYFLFKWNDCILKILVPSTIIFLQ